MEYIEITAKTVSEAITKACMQLGIPSDRLDIQVISEGSKGFLGIGNKPAVIKVAEKSEAEEVAAEKEEVQEEIFEEKVVVSENVSEEIPKEDHTEKEKHRNPRNRRRDNRRKNNRKAEGFAEANEIPAEKPVVVEEKREPLIKTEEEIAAMKESAGSFLKDVFAAMEIPAEINMEYVPENGCLDIDISGDDMGVLIGKRGQTLDSLQYLTSLVVNKDQKDYIRINLDTEDYRRRRKETLENLAKNIASKVKKTRKPVVLEPMNPYERRIIHSALQPNRYVETYSDGNEPYRHIVVAPRKRKEQD
jgi:spoIIIJ-associated protein